jgi:hypothetical protein
MRKRFAWTIAAYVIISFAFAVIWHFVFFKDLYEGFGIYNRPAPIFPLGLGAVLIQAIVLACLYPSFHRESAPYQRGLLFALLMGAFLFSVTAMANAAKILVTGMGAWMAVQLAFHAIQLGLFGIALGWIYKRTTR